MEKRDRIAGGFYGLLIGDALGVPYEFYKADQLPAYEEIDMTPPAGFKKTYPQVDVGTWSDDGAQALCLLDSLLSRKGFSLDSFSDMLLAWYEDGAWAVGNKVFDVACVPQFDTMHPSMSLGAFFNDRNFRRLSGNYPQAYGNIATTKLIQCGIAEMPENKAFHGFCGCGFLPFWSVAALHGLFCPAILHLFLTIASNR